MRTKSAACALVHAKLVGSEGFRLAQSVKAVGSDDEMGNVVKLLMLVSMNNHNELVELCASLAGGDGLTIKLGAKDFKVAFFPEDFEAVEAADVAGHSSFVSGGGRNRGGASGGTGDKEVSSLKGGRLTPFPDRGIPQSGLSAAPRLGRPARASGSSADCATWWSWSPRPDELTVGTSAVPRVVERVAGSCQPIHVIRRQSWITVHISITASPARAPLVARVAKGIVD